MNVIINGSCSLLCILVQEVKLSAKLLLVSEFNCSAFIIPSETFLSSPVVAFLAACCKLISPAHFSLGTASQKPCSVLEVR